MELRGKRMIFQPGDHPGTNIYGLNPRDRCVVLDVANVSPQEVYVQVKKVPNIKGLAISKRLRFHLSQRYPEKIIPGFIPLRLFVEEK